MIKRLLAALAVVFALVYFSDAQVAVSPITSPHQTFVDQNGAICVGCQLFTYQAGSSTPLATYIDSTGTTQNTNPIILDITGSANIWLSANSYKFVLEDASGTVLWSVDNVSGTLPPLIPAVNGTAFGSVSKGWDVYARNLNVSGTISGNPSVSGNPTFTGTPIFTNIGGNPIFSGNISATNVSTGTVVNVLANSYGFSLVADGVTDNCAAMNSLMSAVLAAHPSGGIAYYFPAQASIYHFNPANCTFGVVLNGDNIGIVGDPSPYYDGTTMHGSVLDVPINANSHKGNFVLHMATDCRAMGATTPCDGISSGNAVTTGGGLVVDDYAYVGTYTTNSAHAVLTQSGPDSRITNVRAYSAFHGVAVRSPRTNVSNIHLTDTFDFVVKSDVGSGSVWAVNVSNLVCDSSVLFTGKACQFVITSNAASVTTYNVNLTNASFNDAPYDFVINAENGGTVENVTATNISAFQSTGTAIYTYTTTTGNCNNINLSNSTFLNATVPPVFLNSLNCVNFNPHGVRGNGVPVDDFQSYVPKVGSAAVVFSPPDDTHNSEIEIVGQNAAATVNNWFVTKGGSGGFQSVQFGANASSVISQVQQKLGVAGCTTAASIGGVCAADITITWDNAFADANYQVSCTPNGAPTNVPGVPYVVSGTKLAGTVHINYMALSAAAASWASIDCTAVHP